MVKLKRDDSGPILQHTTILSFLSIPLGLYIVRLDADIGSYSGAEVVHSLHSLGMGNRCA